MACPLCLVDSRNHSFVLLGTIPNGPRVFYTAPARVRDLEHPGKLKLFRQHLRQAANSPWIWIFDCGQMESHHYASMDFTTGLSRILEAEYGDTLQQIIVIRPNLFVQYTLGLLKWILPNQTLQKVHVCAEQDVMRVLRLEHGLTIQLASRLEHIFQTPLDTPLLDA